MGDDISDFIGSKMASMKEQQTKNQLLQRMTGFIPDIAIRSERKQLPSVVSVNGIVLILDISGFTQITEKYSTKRGTEQLTRTLENVLSPLVEKCIQSGGDVVKFAGDAFLTVWKVNETATKQEILMKIAEALDCAFVCQDQHGMYVTDVDIVVRVKMGFGYGPFFYGEVGGDPNVYYAVYGPAVYYARIAESLCDSGEIVVHRSMIDDAFQMLRIDEKRKDYLRVFPPEDKLVKTLGKNYQLKKPLSLALPNSAILRSYVATKDIHVDKLRGYILPIVLKNLDDDIPWEFFNESRAIAIAFLNIDYDFPDPPISKTQADGIIEVVHEALGVCQKMAEKYKGSVNKVLMFDKGLCYLVCFGLPGYAADNITSSALNFSHDTLLGLSKIKGIQRASIGVTTGVCYCGILGHKQRHEYTVIGMRVNEAARLMSAYPGIVSCSYDTMYSSRLPSNSFQLLEFRTLKGVTNVIKVYEYTGEGSAQGLEHITKKQYVYPMLGRVAERMKISDTLKNASEANSHVAPNHSLIVVDGDRGIGKTRFLSSAIQEAEYHKIVSYLVALPLYEESNELAPISALVSQVLGLRLLRDRAVREEHLLKLGNLCPDPSAFKDLHVLNNLLSLKFLEPKLASGNEGKELLTHHENVHQKIKQILKCILKDKRVLLCIDDAHCLSVQAWIFLKSLLEVPQIMCIISIISTAEGGLILPEEAKKLCYKNLKAYQIHLGPLEKEWTLPLCCQLLEVKALPSILETNLYARTEGNPMLLDDTLKQLLLQDKLAIVVVGKGEDIKRSFKGLSEVKAKYIAQEISHDVDPTTRICVIRKGREILQGMVQGGVKEALLKNYDGMNPAEQMLVRCASVLGPQFSRVMLLRLLPNHARDARKYLLSFGKLMESKVFQCASRSRKSANPSGNRPEEQRDSELSAICHCTGIDVIKEELANDTDVQGWKKHFFCRYTEFSSMPMADIVHSLMTNEVSKELHCKVVQYLKSVPVVCTFCGGDFAAYNYGFILETPSIGTAKPDYWLHLKSRFMMQGFQRVRSSISSIAVTMKIKKRFSNISLARSEDDGERRVSRPQAKRYSSQPLNSKKLVPPSRTHKIGRNMLFGIEAYLLRSIRNFNYKGRRLRSVGRLCSSSSDTDRLSENDSYFNNVLLPDDQDTGFDLRGCECPNIYAKICSQIVYHMKEAGKTDKCSAYLAEAAEATINSGDKEQAMEWIAEAQYLVDEGIALRRLSSDSGSSGDTIRASILKKKLLFLRGYALFESGMRQSAKETFLEYLKLVKMKVPKETAHKSIKSGIKIALLKVWRLHWFRRRYLWVNIPHNENSLESYTFRALSYLSKIYQAEGKLDLALLTGLRKLLKAQHSGSYLIRYLPAYDNLVNVYSSMGKLDDAEQYIKRATRMMENALGSDILLDPLQLLSVAISCYSISKFQFRTGDFMRCIQMGFTALKLSNLVHHTALRIKSYPILMNAQMHALDISSLVDSLEAYKASTNNEPYYQGKALYYLQVLTLILELCCPVESINACEAFISTKEWTEYTKVLNQDFQYIFDASFSLFYSRMGKWEEAYRWRSKAVKLNEKRNTLLVVDAKLRLIQTYLITGKHHLFRKRLELGNKLFLVAEDLLKSVEMALGSVPIYSARYYHMMAYLCKLRNRKEECRVHLQKAVSIAKSNDDLLELEFLSHTERVWWSAPAALSGAEYWKNNAGSKSWKKPNFENTSWSNLMYSLPS